MREVIHWINTPFIARLVMFRKFIRYKTGSHHHNGEAISIFARKHAFPSSKPPARIFRIVLSCLQLALTVWAIFTRLFDVTIFANFVWAEAHQRKLSLFDQLDRVLIQSIKVVRGITNIAAPLKTKPFNVFLNRVNVFDIFFYRICIIKT